MVIGLIRDNAVLATKDWCRSESFLQLCASGPGCGNLVLKTPCIALDRQATATALADRRRRPGRLPLRILRFMMV